MNDVCMFLSKPAKLDVELLEVLKLRRETIFTATDQEEGTTYENQTTEKSHSSTAEWTKSAAKWGMYVTVFASYKRHKLKMFEIS